MAKKAAVEISQNLAISCVGVWKNDGVEIIANDQGYRTTPSYVAFTDNERLIGDAAKNDAARNPTNTVFDAKRLIGRKFDDSSIKKEKKQREKKKKTKHPKKKIRTKIIRKKEK
jgi:L1 cell adhesion molecule like protein